ncbi:pyocin knob domain-containing protein [Collinsella intestinalis]|uniref:pyocin knob domain-containing protein n=2 Tax=Collinsella intestinalis TaxID=147207 RepID=UPI0022E92811|nr:pyocin knob domain-containing protein [Collinsella intestinalis]
MAKIKLGNVKGPKGDQGVRGSKWFNTANITGTSTSGTAFPNSGIASAMVGDMALNPTTLNLYICQTAGNAATAKWAFIACIKGPQGAKGDKGDPTTVDAVLSESSANPIQNKAVATKFKDVQDSLGRKADRGGTVSDLNTIEGTGFFVGWNNPNAAPTNVSGAHWYVIQSQFDSDWKMQLATSLGGGEIYMRIKNSGAWQSWRAI